MGLKFGEKEIITFHTSLDYDAWVDYGQKCEFNMMLVPELEDLKKLMELKIKEINQVIEIKKKEQE